MAGGEEHENNPSKNEAAPITEERRVAGRTKQAKGIVAATVVKGSGKLNLTVKGAAKITVVSDRPGDDVSDFRVEDQGVADITLQDNADVRVIGGKSKDPASGQATKDGFGGTDGLKTGRPAKSGSSTPETEPRITVTIRVEEKREILRENVSPVSRLSLLRDAVSNKFPDLDFMFYNRARERLDEEWRMLDEIGVKNGETLIAAREVLATGAVPFVQEPQRN